MSTSVQIAADKVLLACDSCGSLHEIPLLWGFHYSSCYHESAAALVSLHLTKSGAYRAMRKAQWDFWVNSQEEDMLISHLHMFSPRRVDLHRIMYEMQSFMIRPQEVLL